jgi:RNA polymerase sigma-70 factor (ECF subfamily)
MHEHDWLAERFEENRGQLTALAYRMLGSANEADDAVQEAWLRVSGAGADGIENFPGWLTRITARICLDMLRSRKSRREEALDDHAPGLLADRESGPEQEAVLADSVGLALLVVLENLAPAERLAFVLHDMFAVPFEEIAGIVGRSPVAARQLASRARRRVQGASPGSPGDFAARRVLVEAFLAASREGRFDALVAMLHPDAVARADAAAIQIGSPAEEKRGALAVAGFFSGAAQTARLAMVEGEPGLAWAPGRKPRVGFAFVIKDGKILEIEFFADPERLKDIELLA